MQVIEICSNCLDLNDTPFSIEFILVHRSEFDRLIIVEKLLFLTYPYREV